MSASINLESCTNIEKQYCVTETATVIWNDKLQEECKYTRGTDVIGEKSGLIIVSEQGELAVNIIGKITACHTEMWETEQELLIIINNMTTITSPTQHEHNYFHQTRQTKHTTSQIAVI